MLGHLASAQRSLRSERSGQAAPQGDKETRRRFIAKEAKVEPEDEEDEGDEEEDDEDAAGAEAEEERPSTEPEDQREQDEREIVLLQQRLEGHYAHMKNFIRTRAEPTIFYMPVKHTSKTKRNLGETREAIEEKIRSLRVHLRAGLEEPAEQDAESEACSSER